MPGRIPESTPILSAEHVPRFLTGAVGRRLGPEVAAFYRDLLGRDQDNDVVVASVGSFDPYRAPAREGRRASSRVEPPAPVPRPTPPPVARTAPVLRVVDVSASGYLRQAVGPDCRPQNLIDGKTDTAWCEAAPGIGLGQWVEFRLDRNAKIRGFTIVNGYNKAGSFDRWQANGRVHVVAVDVDEVSGRVALEDNRSPQSFTFKEPPTGDRIRFAIGSVYPGHSYSDTCLSEVRIDVVE